MEAAAVSSDRLSRRWAVWPPPGNLPLRKRPGQLCSHSRSRERTMDPFCGVINDQEVIWG
jgi:hypothetical protein